VPREEGVRAAGGQAAAPVPWGLWMPVVHARPRVRRRPGLVNLVAGAASCRRRHHSEGQDKVCDRGRTPHPALAEPHAVPRGRCGEYQEYPRAESGWRGPAPPALPSDAGQTDLPDAPAVRVTVELCRNGRHINRKRVERLMRERGIVGITRRRRRALTKQDAAAAPDRPGAVSLQRCRRAHVHLGHGSHELSSDSPLGTIKFVSPRYHRWHRALAAVRTARTGQRRGTRRSARRPRR
jgi:hypothetical protein